MMLTIPDDVTFQQAIALTQALLDQIEQGLCSADQMEQAIAALAATEQGARGFFVTYLTADHPLADQPTDEVIHALQTSPEIVSELLVKNLAMSTAMAITHSRNEAEDMAQGSRRVRSRTAQLIQQLQLPKIQEKAAQLQHSIETGQGAYASFLQRWEYDEEQQQAIEQALQQITTN